MTGVIRPPYGGPTGPQFSDSLLVDAFASGMRTGHSSRFHIEGDVLLVDRMEPGAIRLSCATFLLSTVHIDELIQYDCWGRLVESDPPLATVVALQLVGHPGSGWDLWSSVPGEARRELARTAAAGDIRDL